MEIQLHDALMLFRGWIVGRTVRGQVVEEVGLEMDTLTKPGTDSPLRYFIVVYFRENEPPKDDPKELKLLARVFSEIPRTASILCHNVGEVRARLVGLKPNHEHEWTLDDESRG
mgnify:CR=1 FL=1